MRVTAMRGWVLPSTLDAGSRVIVFGQGRELLQGWRAKLGVVYFVKQHVYSHGSKLLCMSVQPRILEQLKVGCSAHALQAAP